MQSSHRADTEDSSYEKSESSDLSVLYSSCLTGGLIGEYVAVPLDRRGAMEGRGQPKHYNEGARWDGEGPWRAGVSPNATTRGPGGTVIQEGGDMAPPRR